MDISSYTKNNRNAVYVAIAISIVFFIVVTYLFWHNYEFVGTDQMGNYWVMLEAWGVLMAAGAIAIESMDSNNQKELERQRAFIEQTENNWIELEKYFALNYPFLARLYQQIYSDNKTLKGLPPNLTKDDMFKVVALEQHTCSILFQIIENVYIFLSSQLGTTEYCGWLNVWKSWFKSPIVREQWNLTKEYYNKQTQHFVDDCIILDCDELKQFCIREANAPFSLGTSFENPLEPW